MYTEIELSEFTIRARLKLGEFAEEISEKLQHGINVDDLIQQSTTLRIFLNSLNSGTQTWSIKNLYRRVEYFTELHSLVDKPSRPSSWLDKFTTPKTIVKTGGNYIQLPTNREGFLYLKDGEISFVPQGKLTINDLPNN